MCLGGPDFRACWIFGIVEPRRDLEITATRMGFVKVRSGVCGRGGCGHRGMGKIRGSDTGDGALDEGQGGGDEEEDNGRDGPAPAGKGGDADHAA